VTVARPAASECDKPNFVLQEFPPIMNVALNRQPVIQSRIVVSPVDRDIRDFLSGKTNGEDLLHALYDNVLDEPVPERLRAVLRDGGAG
jgi:hypothetical protein